ncbi:MAG: hypothetical protein A2047_02000 [Omnitrophica bacterium GWA2_41_15]|nr:MAG: hypothetical protein A2047_02000 [Omnitrophica bacterium GWA2_41_15]
MTDVLTKEQRSYNMSQIRSKWTKQEWVIHNYLKSQKIRHTMHPNIEGKPDIILKDSNTAIFLDGCFWHKCPKCFKMPRTRTDFWKNKITKNITNDKKTTNRLRKNGYRVVRVWEHEIKKIEKSDLLRVFRIV